MFRDSKGNKSTLKPSKQEIIKRGRLFRPTGISFESVSGSDPLSEYKLEKVVLADSDTSTFIMKKYNPVLWKVSQFGTENAIFTRLVHQRERDGLLKYSLVPSEYPMEESEIREFSIKVAPEYHLLLTQKIHCSDVQLIKNVSGVISDYVAGDVRKKQI